MVLALPAFELIDASCSGSTTFKLHRENSPVNRVIVIIKFPYFEKKIHSPPCKLPSLSELPMGNYKHEDFSEELFLVSTMPYIYNSPINLSDCISPVCQILNLQLIVGSF